MTSTRTNWLMCYQPLLIKHFVKHTFQGFSFDLANECLFLYFILHICHF